MILSLPYGKGSLSVDLPDDAEVLRSVETPRVKRLDAQLLSALDSPEAHPPLSEALKRFDNALIVIPDNTRAFPTREVLPLLLDYVKRANPKLEIRILIATGLHRPVLGDDLIEIVGRDVAESYEIVNHKADDPDQIMKLDEKTSYGTPIHVNRMVLEAPFVIGLGLIEPHFFAGYSGGGKIILPGVAGSEAIFKNHGYKMIDDPRARAGILEGNPIHEDIIEFAKRAGLDFIVNVTLNKEKEITGIFAGDPIKAHLKGVRFLEKYVKVGFRAEADIVITTNGGYPLDRDFYQALKGMDAVLPVVRDGGVIIIASECRDGLGGHQHYLELVDGARDWREILERIKEREPIYDQWQAQVLARVLRKAKVIVVSDYIDERLAKRFLMRKAKDLNEALEIAYSWVGRDARIIAVPEGPYILPKKISD